MTTLLKINASLFSEDGQSSRLARQFVEALRLAEPSLRAIERDLAADPPPHLTAERFGAFLAKPGERTPAQAAIVAESDALVEELRAADTIVIGLPLYNFGIPSTLKAYFDHVARAGVTFRYTDKGPEGLLTGKRAVVFATRGGLYAGTPADTQSAYVRDFLRFVGIEDVTFVYAEGLALGEPSREAALDRAKSEIARLAGEPATNDARAAVAA